MQPQHLSRILWACAHNCAAASAAEADEVEVDDSILVNALRATVRNKFFTASDAVAVMWCAARLKSIKARRRGLRSDLDELGSWGELEDEKNKWVPRAAAEFYERAEELSLDEREAACWALTQLAGVKGFDQVGQRVEDGDSISSPPEKEFVINAHGRLVRSCGGV